jgi:hypothetical protein
MTLGGLKEDCIKDSLHLLMVNVINVIVKLNNFEFNKTVISEIEQK